MGRYYNGDIDGKFWFAVQSSDDADFFGVEGTSSHLDYYYNKEDDYDNVVKGLATCVKTLGKKKFNLIHKLFSEGGKYYENGYNSEKAEKEYGIVSNDLEWYARWSLGNQIKECLDNNNECSFEAEL